MKTKKQLKKELHEYIDSISDEETLMMVHEDVAAYLNKNLEEAGEEDYLTEEQEKQLEEAIRQADAGETISYEEYLKATARWHTK
jgi:O6-methylguanine-DNA--protein-cysteine methyltransferase